MPEEVNDIGPEAPKDDSRKKRTRKPSKQAGGKSGKTSAGKEGKKPTGKAQKKAGKPRQKPGSVVEALVPSGEVGDQTPPVEPPPVEPPPVEPPPVKPPPVELPPVKPAVEPPPVESPPVEPPVQPPPVEPPVESPPAPIAPPGEALFEAPPAKERVPRFLQLMTVSVGRYWRPLSIFVVALFVRLIYNLLVLDFRVCDQGGASDFLSAAAQLLAWGSGQTGPPGIGPVKSISEIWLTTGPVYPAFLAVVGLFLRMIPYDPDLSHHCIQFAVVNSIFDSTNCCLVYYAGRLAFDRRAAYLAGVVMALYPSAIINTQHCYCEPFASLLLTGWICLLLMVQLRHWGSRKADKMPALPGEVSSAGGPRPAVIWASLGILTALVMMVKPVFFALPAVVFAALAAIRVPKQFEPRCLLMLLGCMATILIPWLCFTSSASASPSFFSARVAGINFFSGNDLRMDGWQTTPVNTDVPHDSPRAIAQSAIEHPLEFLGLQLRKVPRLWASGWNDNLYNLPIIDVYDQMTLHQLLLFCAALGATFALSGPGFRRLSRSSRSGVVLITVVLFHFVYCLFDPVSRDNFTAMPAVVLLAAYAVVQLLAGAHRLRWRLVICILAAAFLLRLLQGGSSLYAYLAEFMPKALAYLIPWVDALFWAAAWYVVWRLTRPTLTENELISRPATAGRCLILVFSTLAVVQMACCLGDPERKEWWTDLDSSEQIIRQDIYVPPVAAVSTLGQQALVLIDLESPIMLPRLALAVNGERADALPLTWLQVEGGHDDLLAALAAQARSMGRDIRNLRQWWVLPISSSLLRFGASNTIMIKSLTTGWTLPMRIYGDYSPYGLGSSEVPRILPSLSTMSLAKGFHTYDHHDPRIYEEVRLLGKETDSHWFAYKDWSNNDLSPNPGRQVGEFRIRLGLVEKATIVGGIEHGPAGLSKPVTEEPPQVVPFAPISIAQFSGPQTVAGWDLSSMMLTQSTLRLPSDIPSGALFLFSCELRDFEPYGSAMVSVQFVGDEYGKPVSWTSSWQPSRIALTQEWTPLSFADVIPDRILRLNNLRVNIIVAPYHEEQMLVSPSRALQETAAVQNASLAILPPLQMPPPKQRRWMFY